MYSKRVPGSPGKNQKEGQEDLASFQEEPGGARRTQEEPGGARSCQEGQEDQMTLKQLGGYLLALVSLLGPLGLTSGSCLGSLEP